MLHSGRFLTLHKRRKKKPPTRAIKSDQALLDDLYHGPIHVSFNAVNSPSFNCSAFDSFLALFSLWKLSRVVFYNVS